MPPLIDGTASFYGEPEPALSSTRFRVGVLLAVMKSDALAAEEWRFQKTGDAFAFAACKASNEARAAVAELIERDKAAQEVFDCILRGVNDGNVSRFGDGWLRCWAKALLAAGFKPSNPDAGDIQRGLVRVQGEGA